MSSHRFGGFFQPVNLLYYERPTNCWTQSFTYQMWRHLWTYRVSDHIFIGICFPSVWSASSFVSLANLEMESVQKHPQLLRRVRHLTGVLHFRRGYPVSAHVSWRPRGDAPASWPYPLSLVLSVPTPPDWVPRWPRTNVRGGSSACPCYRWQFWDLITKF